MKKKITNLLVEYEGIDHTDDLAFEEAEQEIYEGYI